MFFGDFGSRVFATSCNYIIILDTAKKPAFFSSLHAEQRKFVSVNAEFLSDPEV